MINAIVHGTRFIEIHGYRYVKDVGWFPDDGAGVMVAVNPATDADRPITHFEWTLAALRLRLLRERLEQHVEKLNK